MRAVTEGYRNSGLPRHEGKAVSRASAAEFWGGSLDGHSGLLRPSPKRTTALAQFVLRVVSGGITSVGMLEVVAGGLVSGLQLRRRQHPGCRLWGAASPGQAGVHSCERGALQRASGLRRPAQSS